MVNLITDPVFDWYALAAIVVALTLYGLGFNTAKVRAERKIVVNAEDAGINGNARVEDSEHADVLRIKRAHLNALENAVPFFLLGFLYALTSPSLGMARGLYLTFVVVRLFHAFFYLSAKQPFRTASFGVGALVNVIMAVQVLRAVVPHLS